MSIFTGYNQAPAIEEEKPAKTVPQNKGIFEGYVPPEQPVQEPSVASQIPQVAAQTAKQFGLRAAKSFPEFSKGLNDALALAGDKTGAQALSNFGRTNAEFWQNVSDKIPQDPNYSGLQGLSGGWQTAIPTIAGEVGGQATNLLMAMGGGAAGGAIAKAGSLGKAGTAASVIAGTSIPNLAQEGQYLDKIQAFMQINGRMPSSDELRKIQNIALTEKGVNTALETVADRLLFAKIFPEGIVTKGFKNIAKSAGQQSLTEAFTEGMQEGVSIGAENALGINQGGNLNRLAEAMAIGGLTGGVIGGGITGAQQIAGTDFSQIQAPQMPQAVKEVAAKIYSGGKELYNSAADVLNQPTAFDNLRALRQEGSLFAGYEGQTPSTEQMVEHLAPNTAKKQKAKKQLQSSGLDVQTTNLPDLLSSDPNATAYKINKGEGETSLIDSNTLAQEITRQPVSEADKQLQLYFIKELSSGDTETSNKIFEDYFNNKQKSGSKENIDNSNYTFEDAPNQFGDRYDMKDSNGNLMGYLEYEKGDNGTISIEQVNNVTKRKTDPKTGKKIPKQEGEIPSTPDVAEKLVNKLIADNPDANIKWDAATTEGRQFKLKYLRKYPELKGRISGVTTKAELDKSKKLNYNNGNQGFVDERKNNSSVQGQRQGVSREVHIADRRAVRNTNAQQPEPVLENGLLRSGSPVNTGRKTADNSNEGAGRTAHTRHLASISKTHKNQHELNTAIEDFVKNKEYEQYSEVPEDVKEWLKQYTGAGGLEKQGAEGKGLLSEYYTPANIVKKMWDLTSQYVNTDGAKVLEPSAGIGRFMEYAPEGTQIDAVEMNPVSAEISKILYPDANVSVGEFQQRFINPETNTPVKSVNGEYDIVIGNPPYGKYSGRYKGMGEGKGITRLETYFIKRGLDSLKKNGVMTFIVPSSFLDGTMTPEKLEIAKNAQILDAYRLPENTFDTTSIGTDVIVLRKKRNIDNKSQFFNGSYFKENPKKVLGAEEARRNRFGQDEIYVKGDKNAIDSVDTSTKSIEETKATVQKPEAKTAVKKNLTTEKAPIIKGRIEYEAYVPEQTVSDEEYKIYADTLVDGSLPRIMYKADSKISQYKGKLYNDFNYLQGDIYEKLDALESEKISAEQKEVQRKKLMSVLPAQKELSEIKLSPTSDFVAEFPLGETEEEYYDYRDRRYKERTINDNLLRRFKDYVNDTSSAERNYISSFDLRSYLDGDRLRLRTLGDEEQKKRQKVEQLTKIKNTADKLFADFVDTNLSKEEKQQLKEAWNRKFNAVYNPDYNKLPLMIKDMNSKFYGRPLKLLDVQKEGINFLTNKGVGLLGFEVGVGKTLSGIVSTVENMQMGRTKKPLILVPKQVKANWIREINQLFPNMEVNDLGNLSKFKGEIKDGTLSVATYEALGNIWYNSEEMSDLVSKLYSVAGDFQREATKRGMESLKEDVEKMLGIAEKGNKKLFTIEELGFDHITVDEAHNFRNLFRSAKAYGRENNDYQAIGQSGDPSSRAARMFLLAQHILDKNNNRNVFMLTATPFNNSPLEVFNMLSFIGKDKLDKMGLYNVYQFMTAYADIEADWVVKNNNNVDFSQVVKGFKNASSLRELIKSLMMIRGADEAGVKRPTKHVRRVTLEPTEEQLNLISRFEEEALAAAGEGKDGAVLKKINQTRQVTLSPDIATKDTEVTPEEFVKNSPKLSYVAKAVAEMKKKRPNTSQLIYMPLGVEYLPKLKQYFVNKGIFKADEIEIISSNTKDDKIPEVTDSFNSVDGKIKLIIGTQKIKEGMNLNGKTSILYVPFIDWNPTDFIQITGRIWRQGNKYENIKVVVPLLKNSSDPFMFQKLDEKTSRINNIMDEGKEYIETGELNSAEEKLNMITMPDKKAKMFTNVQRQKLNNEKTSLQGRIETSSTYQKNLEDEKNNIEKYEKQLDELDKKISETTSEWQLKNYMNDLDDTKRALKKSQKRIKNIQAAISRFEFDFEGKDNPDELKKQIDELDKKVEQLEAAEKEKFIEYSEEYVKQQANKKSIDDHIADFKQSINAIFEDGDEYSLPVDIAPKKKYEKTREVSYDIPKINLETKAQALRNQTRKEKLKSVREVKDAKKYDKTLKEGVRNWVAEIEKRRYTRDKALNEFIIAVRQVSKELGVSDKAIREIMPFLRERTELPQSLNRPDLHELWNKLSEKNKNRLRDMADAVSDKLDRYYQEYQAVQAGDTENLTGSDIENYITHIWDFDGNKEQKSLATNYFATKSRFAKQRSIETLFEGIEGIELENGEIMKLQPKVLDYAELLHISSDSLIKATVDKVFADQVRNFKTDEGLNLVLPASQAPSNWVEINNSAVNKTLARPVSTKYGEVVSPELQNILADMGIAMGRRLNKYKSNGQPNAFGKYVKSQPPEIRLQRWFSNKTLAHEVGHAIDNALNLRSDGFVSRYRGELEELNKERIEAFDKVGNKHYAQKDSELIAELAGVVFNDPELAYKTAPQATVEFISKVSDNKKISKLLPANFDWENAKHVLEEKTVELFKVPVKVHPDIADTLKVIFESQGETTKAGQIYDKSNAILKQSQLGFSGFHMLALSEGALGNIGVKETLKVLNPVKMFNAVKNNDWDIYKNEPLAKQAIDDGLQIDATLDIHRGTLEKIFEDTARWINKNVPVGSKALNIPIKALASTQGAIGKVLWDYLHNTYKIRTYELAIEQFEQKEGKAPTQNQRREIAQWVNDSYGGQVYEVLRLKPSQRKAEQRIFLSPDWLRSTVREGLGTLASGTTQKALNSLPNEGFWKIAKEQARQWGIGSITDDVTSASLRGQKARAYFARSIIYSAILYNAINAFFRMRDKEEYPELYPKNMTAKDYSTAGNSIGFKTYVFIGRNKDGTERYWRLGKKNREVPEILEDPLVKLGNKASPVAQLVSQTFTGKTVGNYENWNLKDKHGWERTKALAELYAKSLLPFSFTSLIEPSKEFTAYELFAPTSRGMTFYKGKNLYKEAIKHKDRAKIREVTRNLQMNKVDANKVMKSTVQDIIQKLKKETKHAN